MAEDATVDNPAMAGRSSAEAVSQYSLWRTFPSAFQCLKSVHRLRDDFFIPDRFILDYLDEPSC
jgi:hypothetical protein